MPFLDDRIDTDGHAPDIGRDVAPVIVFVDVLPMTASLLGLPCPETFGRGGRPGQETGP